MNPLKYGFHIRLYVTEYKTTVWAPKRWGMKKGRVLIFVFKQRVHCTPQRYPICPTKQSTLETKWSVTIRTIGSTEATLCYTPFRETLEHPPESSISREFCLELDRLPLTAYLWLNYRNYGFRPRDESFRPIGMRPGPWPVAKFHEDELKLCWLNASRRKRVISRASQNGN